ncbi:hypothetical protein LOAG_01853 [Loa loa]|uniref:Uncharacterized protein n=1 Tax=Loa loa TaxID=7209 RepID=A0A1I7VS25_LOALO|nr:hypothetical protein LOAG_01853 [Loa loa]EFO26629.1 hypothetical protein LOAG_01853 [Loa loa]
MKKAKKERRTTTTSTEQVVQKPQKEAPVKSTSMQTSISTIPTKCQQLQIPDVKQSEIEINSVSQKKVTGKEGITEDEMNERNVKDQTKTSQGMNEDEIASEYLPTPMDYFLNGQLVSRPSRYDEAKYNLGDRS